MRVIVGARRREIQIQKSDSSGVRRQGPAEDGLEFRLGQFTRISKQQASLVPVRTPVSKSQRTEEVGVVRTNG